MDKLIRPFKDKLDADDMTLTAAVELSYLLEDEQKTVALQDVKVDEKMAKAVRAAAGELTEGKLEEILHPAKAPVQAKMVSVKIPVEVEEKYFSIITTDAYDMAIMSRNTGHYWYLHNPEYPEQGTVIIFHKYKASHLYHQHGRANTLRQVVRSIRGHDRWQMNGRKR